MDIEPIAMTSSPNNFELCHFEINDFPNCCHNGIGYYFPERVLQLHIWESACAHCINWWPFRWYCNMEHGSSIWLSYILNACITCTDDISHKSSMLQLSKARVRALLINEETNYILLPMYACMFRGCPLWNCPWKGAIQLGQGEGPIGLVGPLSQPRGTIDTASLTLNRTCALPCTFWSNFTLGS